MQAPGDKQDRRLAELVPSFSHSTLQGVPVAMLADPWPGQRHHPQPSTSSVDNRPAQLEQRRASNHAASSSHPSAHNNTTIQDLSHDLLTTVLMHLWPTAPGSVCNRRWGSYWAGDDSLCHDSAVLAQVPSSRNHGAVIRDVLHASWTCKLWHQIVMQKITKVAIHAWNPCTASIERGVDGAPRINEDSLLASLPKFTELLVLAEARHTALLAITVLMSLTCLDLDACIFEDPRRPRHSDSIAGIALQQVADVQTRSPLLALQKLKSLRQLSIARTPLRKPDIVALKQLSALESLRLAHMAKPNPLVLMQCASSLPQLKKLTLSWNTWSREIRDTDIQILTALTGLQELDLSGRSVVPFSLLEPLTQLSELRALRLRRCTELDEETGPILKAMSALRELDLTHNNITDDDIVPLLRAPQLTYIKLKRNTITARGIGQLSGLPNLQLLDVTFNQHLDFNAIPDDILPHLLAPLVPWRADGELERDDNASFWHELRMYPVVCHSGPHSIHPAPDSRQETSHVDDSRVRQRFPPPGFEPIYLRDSWLPPAHVLAAMRKQLQERGSAALLSMANLSQEHRQILAARWPAPNLAPNAAAAGPAQVAPAAAAPAVAPILAQPSLGPAAQPMWQPPRAGPAQAWPAAAFAAPIAQPPVAEFAMPAQQRSHQEAVQINVPAPLHRAVAEPSSTPPNIVLDSSTFRLLPQAPLPNVVPAEKVDYGDYPPPALLSNPDT